MDALVKAKVAHDQVSFLATLISGNFGAEVRWSDANVNRHLATNSSPLWTGD
jgi:hypothetical protein